MPRNLDTRVELVAPVETPALRDEVLDVLERSLADQANAWDLQPDGAWRRRETANGSARSVQRELMARHAERAGAGIGAA
jgi:polyphosphate kinase